MELSKLGHHTHGLRPENEQATGPIEVHAHPSKKEESSSKMTADMTMDSKSVKNHEAHFVEDGSRRWDEHIKCLYCAFFDAFKPISVHALCP